MPTSVSERTLRWLRRGLLASVLLIPISLAVGESALVPPPALTAVTMLASSVPETVAGVWLIVWARRRRLTAQLLLAISLFVLGTGRTLLGIELAVSNPHFPNVFYALAHLSTGFAAVSFFLLPRVQPEPLRALRTAVEGLVLASVLTVALEVFWLEGVFGGVLTRPAVLAWLITLSTSWLLGLMFAVLIREQAAWIGRLTIVLVLLLLADMLTWQAALASGGRFPWLANVITLPVWAIAVSGVLATLEPHGAVATADRPRWEHQRNLLFSLVILVLAVAVGLGMLVHPTITAIRVLGAAVAIGALVGRDVVRSQQTSELLARLARQGRTDTLTQCGNRLALEERLDELTAHASQVHLLTMDLDGFKHVNTQYGLGVGDRVLREIAAALRVALAGVGEVFRLGGDEFAIVVVGHPADADEAAGRVHVAVVAAMENLHDLGTASLSASVGISSSEPGGSPDRLQGALTRSSHAMMAAKARGRSRTVRYDDTMSQSQHREARLQARMSAALSRPGGADDFDVVFQPMFSRQGDVLAVEALTRWHDEELREVSPAEFIPAAEAAGLIEQLGERVLRQAIERFATEASPDCGLAVNVSTIQLRSGSFDDTLLALLAEHRIQPNRVLVEVTESVFVHPGDPAVATLIRLADAGVAVAVDDFGSGYSSFGYLGRLPVNVIKLDASLIWRLNEPRSIAIVRSVVDLSRELGLGVVAEGIETAEQLATIRALGIEVTQGFLLGRPDLLSEIDLRMPSTVVRAAVAPSPWSRFIPRPAGAPFAGVPKPSAAQGA